MPRPFLTPCLICEKAVIYLWTEEQAGDATNLNDAVDFEITGSYGSRFDTNIYHAVMCDDCLEEAIQKRRVSFVRSYL
jgi:hypothetical protein